MARTSAPIPADEQSVPSRPRGRAKLAWLDRGWSVPLASAVLSLVALVPVMKLWRADLQMPFAGYSSDAMLNLALVKGVLENGWFLENSKVGVPSGLEMYDFAIFGGDNLHFLLIKLLGLFSSDPATVINLFALLTFPLTAIASSFAFRRLGVAPGPTVVCSVLFTLLPYHFLRVFGGHLFLGAYWAVPLGSLLALSVLAGERVVARTPGRHGMLAFASGTTLVTLLLCLVIASSGIYYAAFTIMLLVLAGPLAAVVRRSWTPLWSAGLVAGVIGAVLLVNLSPTLVYRVAEGPNEAVGTRQPQESETFSVKLAQLVLPVPGHRIDRLADARARYDTSAPPPADYGVALGTVATLGLGVLLFTVLAATLGLRGPPVWWDRLRHSSVLALATLLTITVGGASTLIAYGLSPQLRAWYRLSVFVAFFAFLAVGLLLTAARPRFAGLKRGNLLYAAGLAIVLVLGVLDQTTSLDVPAYDAQASQFRSDRTLVRAIERRLPAGSEVFELPYVPFPETVQGRIDAYDGARGYVHSHDLRWSWGAMMGRPDDWQAQLADEPVEVAATAAAAAGFEGLWLDRFGFGDSGADAERRLTALTGEKPLTSPDSRLSFYDLRGLANCERTRFGQGQVQALGVATIRPLVAGWGAGFWQQEGTPPGDWRWADQRAELTLTNPTSETRRAVLSTGIHSGVAGSYGLTMKFPDGRTERIPISAKPRSIRRTFDVPPGDSEVVFETNAPLVPVPGGTRSLHVSFDAPRVDEDAIVDAGQEFRVCAAA